MHQNEYQWSKGLTMLNEKGHYTPAKSFDLLQSAETRAALKHFAVGLFLEVHSVLPDSVTRSTKWFLDTYNAVITCLVSCYCPFPPYILILTH